MSSSQQAMSFPLLSRKPLQVDFTGGLLSSDGGLLLLAPLDQKLRLTERVAACIQDRRLKERIQQPLLDLLRQRIYQIAAGYEDANDATSLRADPALKVAVGRCPTSDADLASQPTLSRLEKVVTSAFVAGHQRALSRLLPGAGAQGPTRVDPRLRYFRLSDARSARVRFLQRPLRHLLLPAPLRLRQRGGESQEYLVSAELRPSDAKEVEGIRATLKRLVERIRTQWPKTQLIVRGDGWFATPEL
jgi:Transposase DDE domain group 1